MSYVYIIECVGGGRGNILGIRNIECKDIEVGVCMDNVVGEIV